jgi:hypothetical protein
MAKTLPTASDLIVEAWLNGRRHWPTYLEFTVLYLIVGAAQWGVAVAARLTTTAGAWYAVMGGGSLVTALFASFITVALVYNVWQGLDDDAPSIIASLEAAGPRYGAFIAVSVLAFLASLGGLVLFAVGTLLLFLLYRFAGYAVIIDKRGAWSALGESRHLFDERFWGIVWRMTATYAYFFTLTNLLAFLPLAAAGAAQGDLGMFFGPFSTWSNLPSSQLFIITMAPALASALTMPLLTASELRLWRELKKA